jgi:carbonic anhydrase/acetyltransferase-like protein (isoleucine patch superfamily)
MIIPSPQDLSKVPKISPEAFIAKNAVIIGDVTIEAGANIWYGAVLRGDVCEIKIGENTSIQDNCVVHAEIGTKAIVEDHCIVGHLAMVHGDCHVGRCTTVGLKATVLANTTIGEGALIAAGAVARKIIPPYALITGVPGVFKKDLGPKNMDATKRNAQFYAINGKKFKEAGECHIIPENCILK